MCGYNGVRKEEIGFLLHCKVREERRRRVYRRMEGSEDAGVLSVFDFSEVGIGEIIGKR